MGSRPPVGGIRDAARAWPWDPFFRLSNLVLPFHRSTRIRALTFFISQFRYPISSVEFFFRYLRYFLSVPVLRSIICLPVFFFCLECFLSVPSSIFQFFLCPEIFRFFPISLIQSFLPQVLFFLSVTDDLISYRACRRFWRTGSHISYSVSGMIMI